MKIIAFAASSSTKSINKQLVTYACSLLQGAKTEILDLNDYSVPLFSEDEEQTLGQPTLAVDFLTKIGNADAIIISFAEHNGSYTAAYKNLFDWCSRIKPKVFQNKPMVLLSTSPGARGGMGVLTMAVNSAPFFAGEVKASLSLPSFHSHFDVEKGVINNTEWNEKLTVAVNTLQ